MDLYEILKFLHITVAMLWLGGAFAVVYLGLLAERAQDTARLRAVMQQVGILAPRIFVPGSAVVLVLGLLMIWVGNLAWEAWNVLSLIGIVIGGALGARVLSPLGERAKEHFAEGREAEAVRDCHRCMSLAKFDLVMLYAIVFLMVTKPGWTDWPALLVVALALALGALAFLRPEQRQPAPAV